MAFTVKEEYNRLIKIKAEQEKKMGHLLFECGVACGIVTKIEYVPRSYNQEVHRWFDDEIHVYAIAGWDKNEKLAIVIGKEDVSRQYKKRKYYFNKQYGILDMHHRKSYSPVQDEALKGNFNKNEIKNMA